MPPPGKMNGRAPPMVMLTLPSWTALVSLIGFFVTPALAEPPTPAAKTAVAFEGWQESASTSRNAFAGGAHRAPPAAPPFIL